MPEQVVIDGIEFARSGKHLSGDLEIGSLGRLRESLSSSEGAVEYSIRGGQNPKGRPMLHLTVKGTLSLTCQRCLGALAFPVDVRSDLLLLQDESEFADIVDEDDDSVDAVVAAPRMSVAALVEDEVILALPYAPRHPEGECSAGGAALGEATVKASPFAALKQLKK